MSIARWTLIPPVDRAPLADEVGRLFLLGQDTAQIAHELGYPESTIYSALHSWRERRRQQA